MSAPERAATEAAMASADVLYRCARVGCRATALTRYAGPPREALLDPKASSIEAMPEGWGYDRVAHAPGTGHSGIVEEEVLHCPNHRVWT